MTTLFSAMGGTRESFERFSTNVSPETAFAINALPAFFKTFDPRGERDEPDIILCQHCHENGESIVSIESDFSGWNKYTIEAGSPSAAEIKILNREYKKIAGSARAQSVPQNGFAFSQKKRTALSVYNNSAPDSSATSSKDKPEGEGR